MAALLRNWGNQVAGFAEFTRHAARTITDWARDLKRDVAALWIAARDARTPWPAKLLAGLVVAYALSPVDLIPDFIPVIGYLDDLIIVPLGLLLAIRMMPEELMAEFRSSATAMAPRPKSFAGLIFIGAVWLIAAAILFRWLNQHFAVLPALSSGV